jgi:hypothetical protein
MVMVVAEEGVQVVVMVAAVEDLVMVGYLVVMDEVVMVPLVIQASTMVNQEFVVVAEEEQEILVHFLKQDLVVAQVYLAKEVLAEEEHLDHLAVVQVREEQAEELDVLQAEHTVAEELLIVVEEALEQVVPFVSYGQELLANSHQQV